MKFGVQKQIYEFKLTALKIHIYASKKFNDKHRILILNTRLRVRKLEALRIAYTRKVSSMYMKFTIQTRDRELKVKI